MSSTDEMSVASLLEQSLKSYRQRDLPAAEHSLQRVLKAEPDNFDALNLLGVLMTASGRQAEAAELLERAVAQQPGNIGVQTNLGMAYFSLRRWEKALGICDAVLRREPDQPTALLSRAMVYFELNQLDKALHDVRLSLRARPDHPHALVFRGKVLAELGRHDAAVASFDRAIAVSPELAEAHAKRSSSLQQLDRDVEALDDLRRAHTLKPDDARLRGQIVNQQRKLCDWAGIEAATDDVAARIQRGEFSLDHFTSLSILASPGLQLKAAQSDRRNVPLVEPLPRRERRDGPIRLGYFSYNFDRHPTMLLAIEALSLHDRQRFHTTAFLYRDRSGGFARNLDEVFDRTVDIMTTSDRDAAQLARSLDIDIAIDMDGFTLGNRLGIFRERAAPLQVGYLGYPGTVGGTYMDYIIADRTLIPPESTQHYAEKAAWLPYTYQPRDRRMLPAETRAERQAEGLPETGFVYCCFNNAYKLTPDAFADWMQILNGTEGSVLWLLKAPDLAKANLRREAVRHGVDPERLLFAAKRDLRDHLARIALADLVLDTRPYNAHTTASDALFMGVPMLTLPGETFASRVAASLLKSIGMPELIAESREQYVADAIAIGNSPDRLAVLKAKLARNRETEPLFDIPAYTRYLEDAYTQMLDRHQRGLPADHITVVP